MREYPTIAVCLITAALIAGAWLATRAESFDAATESSNERTLQPSCRHARCASQDACSAPGTPRQELPEAATLIEKIRGQVGSPLSGSVFGEVGREALPQSQTTEPCGAHGRKFAEIYAEIAHEARPQNALPPEHRTDPPILPIAEGPAVRSPHDAEVLCARSLREAARHLEVTAADLEDFGSFEQADKLRRWARRMRLEARRERTPTSE